MSELCEDRMVFLRVKAGLSSLSIRAEVAWLFGRLVVKGNYSTERVNGPDRF